MQLESPVSQGFWPPAEREKKYLPIWMMRFPIGSRWPLSGALVFPNFDKSDRRRLPLLKPLVTRDSSFLQDKFQQLHTNGSGVRVGNCELNLALLPCADAFSPETGPSTQRHAGV